MGAPPAGMLERGAMRTSAHRPLRPRGCGWLTGVILALLGAVVPGAWSGAPDPLSQWHVHFAPNHPTRENLEGVAYGAGRWVVVGQDGTILSSPDGAQWQTETSPVAPSGLKDLCFANGIFVAAGARADALVTSTDGRHWVRGDIGVSGVEEIIHDGSRFVALAAGGYLRVSTDGVHWTSAGKVPTQFVDAGGIAFGKGTYVEVGYRRTGKPTDLYSAPDLQSWTFREANASENLFNVGFGLGQFIAVGQEGTLITSPDGVQWTPRNAPHTGFIWDVATDGQHLVAAAQWGRLLVSANGVDWTRHETDLPWHLTDIAFGNGTFVAVGWDGQIVQSDPVGPAPSAGEIRLFEPWRVGPAFGFSFAAEVGKTYDVLVSTDGRDWSWWDTVRADANPMVITDPDAGGKARLYRILGVASAHLTFGK